MNSSRQCSVVAVLLLVAEETAHINVSFLFLSGLGLFCWCRRSGGTGSWCSTGSWRARGSLQESGGLWELVSGFSSDGNQILEATEQSVRSGHLSGVTETERKTGLSRDGSLELRENGLRRKVEDRGVEHATVLQDFLDLHLVREWIDLELIEQSSLGTGDPFALGDDLLLGDDINLGFHNLSLDLQGLEETGLLWIETSGSWLNGHIVWGDHTGLGWRWSDFLVENGLDLIELTVGHDQTSVAAELSEDLVDVWIMLPGTLSFLIILIARLWLLVGSGQSGFHQGVLAHDHVGIDLSESRSDLQELQTGDVVCVDKENILVVSDCLL